MTTLKTAAGRGAAVGAILGLTWAGALVVREAAAAIYAVPALQLMEQWQEDRVAAQAVAMAEAARASMAAGHSAEDGAELSVSPEEVPFSPDPRDWDTARAALEKALALAPGNPELHANRGRLYQFRFEDRSLPLDDIRRGAEQALASFEQAASLRPTWPYHWWDIARTEYVLQRTYQPEFYRALDNVTRFGPWLEDVQLFAADLALEHWGDLQAESRTLALANIDRALGRNPEIASSMVASYQAWDPVCEASRQASGDYLQIAQYCVLATQRTFTPDGSDDLNTVGR
ncbi:hypothetical protein FV139_19445 [Parahaliea maris]|uniref:Tetratricopeptide repeat protein n=1 Tax=Parahaliea maris TaxID=2716870 RepID=A0A5C8ZQD2_9GAMM|nr:hypothetical protein [Parahaliea maris]TXS89902.1 hypothetical protein FV139_19445 [Parahaliea maris]